MFDKRKIQVADLDDELSQVQEKKRETKKEPIGISDQFAERTLIVKAFVFLLVFVVTAFVLIFSYQLLFGGNVDKTMDVFQKLSSIASPIITLVLGYYFGSKAKK